MLLSTCSAFWEPVRDSLLPLVVALLSTIVTWVAWRLRSISEAERSISQVVETNYVLLHKLLGRNVLPPSAQDPKKSSSRGTTST
ncbi:MAG TPA: hypothetical protein VNT52_17590 [Acidimicrobiales bacterium]|jgi:hypothetical protein|nr:hypothetical protein [Acidimicrobiales bacterium]